MEATYFYETSVRFQRITQRYIPKDSTLQPTLNKHRHGTDNQLHRKYLRIRTALVIDRAQHTRNSNNKTTPDTFGEIYILVFIFKKAWEGSETRELLPMSIKNILIILTNFNLKLIF
jgi:hypothetical protein